MNDDSLSPVFNLRGCEFEKDKFNNTNLYGSEIPYKIRDNVTKK
jgi:hypothetical protein